MSSLWITSLILAKYSSANCGSITASAGCSSPRLLFALIFFAIFFNFGNLPSYDPVYGARPLKRYVQKNVETMAAKLILSDGAGEGDTILIDEKGGNLVGETVKK